MRESSLHSQLRAREEWTYEVVQTYVVVVEGRQFVTVLWGATSKFDSSRYRVLIVSTQLGSFNEWWRGRGGSGKVGCVVSSVEIPVCLIAKFLRDKGAAFLSFALRRRCFTVSNGALLVLYRRNRRRCSVSGLGLAGAIIRIVRSRRSLAPRHLTTVSVVRRPRHIIVRCGKV